MGIGIIIAGIVAYIAWQQYKIERDKLRFSFYDRRLKVFESLMDLFVTIGENGKVNDEIWHKYHIGKTEAPFLFGSEVSDYIEKVDRNALHLLFACNTLKDLPAGEERSTKAKEISKLLQWFSTEHVHVTSKFEKYFKFEQIGQPSRLWYLLSLAFHRFGLSFKKWTSEWSLGRKRSNDNK